MSSNKLSEGMDAPDFCLKNQDEEETCLKSYQGNWVVVYFYPKDNTPGCSIEAQAFTRQETEFQKLNTQILGISKDTCKSHRSFREKKELTITLLSDTETKVNQLFGVWQLKKFMGREFMGTVRSTFIINPKGKIVKIWEKVKVKGHIDEVLTTVKALQ